MRERQHQGTRRPNPVAIETAARLIRKDRYLTHTVTDEQLVERVVIAYQDASRRRPRGVEIRNGSSR